MKQIDEQKIFFNLMLKQEKEEQEKIYLEFLYCLYKGIISENISKNNFKNNIDEAIRCYQNDPIFHRIYNLNKQLFPKHYLGE